ncbi:hypothetical protein [Streptomyces griseofuscus]|uniref:hypothetical protein n=1 Tax=Streptomyces griseofuscus TaxID=146922 RepID=UPI003815FDA7
MDHPGHSSPDRKRADRTYASRENRACPRHRGICAIPDKADQARDRKKPGSCGDRRASTRPTTANATRSGAASTVSGDIALSPPATTKPAVRYEATVPVAAVRERP